MICLRIPSSSSFSRFILWSCARPSLSFLMSCRMIRNEMNSKEEAETITKTNSLKEKSPASVIFSSRLMNAACACPSRWVMSICNFWFKALFCMRRLSVYMSIRRSRSSCMAISFSFKSCSPFDGSKTCTLLFPPNQPAIPFFFWVTVRVRTASLITIGRRFASRLSASPCLVMVSIMRSRCISLASNK